jgi:hypothetical protein
MNNVLRGTWRTWVKAWRWFQAEHILENRKKRRNI